MHLKENKSFMKSFEYILLLSVLKYSSHCDFIIKIKFNTERGALSPALANLKQTEKPTRHLWKATYMNRSTMQREKKPN